MHVARPAVSANLPLAQVLLCPGQSMQVLAEERAVPGEALPLVHPVHTLLADAPTAVE